MSSPLDNKFPLLNSSWYSKPTEEKREDHSADIFREISRIDQLEELVLTYLSNKDYSNALACIDRFKLDEKDLSEVEVVAIQLIVEEIRHKIAAHQEREQLQPLNSANNVPSSEPASLPPMPANEPMQGLTCADLIKLLEEKRFEEVRQQLESVTDKNDPLFPILRLLAHYYSGNYDEALAFADVCRIDSSSCEIFKQFALLLKAEIFRLTSNDKGNKESFRLLDAITNEKLANHVKLLRAINFLNQGRRKLAVEALKDVHTYEAYYLTSRLCAEMQHFNLVLDACNKALKLNSTSIETLELRCWINLRSVCFPSVKMLASCEVYRAAAKSDLEQILHLEPQNESAPNLQNLFERLDKNPSIREFESVKDDILRFRDFGQIKLFEFSSIIPLLNFMHSEQKNHLTSIEAISEKASFPIRPLDELMADAAQVTTESTDFIKLLEENRFEELRQYVESVTDTNDHLFPIIRVLTHYYSGNNSEAIHFADVCLQGSSSKEIKQLALILKADILRLTEKFNEALLLLKSLKTTNEQIKKIARYIEVIITLRLQGLRGPNRVKIDTNITEYTQSHSFEYHHLKGMLALESQQYSSAITEFKAALEVEPDNVKVQELCCWADFRLSVRGAVKGRKDYIAAARELLNRILRLDPSNKKSHILSDIIKKIENDTPVSIKELEGIFVHGKDILLKPLNFSFYSSLLNLILLTPPKVDLPSVNIDPKYLIDGALLPEPQPQSILTQEKFEWLKQPSLEFEKVSVKSPDPEMLGQRVDTDEFVGSYFSEKGNFPGPNERCTFVMLGRKGEGHIPQETNGGRVILVVPTDDLGEALNWVGPHTDVLLIESFKNGFKEQTLGLVTARRLATLSFAYHCNLNSILMIDDNLDKFYVSEKASGQEEGQQLSWKDVYQLFDAAGQTHEMSCVSAKTFNYLTDVKPNANELTVKTSKDGSKIFFMDLKRLRGKIQKPGHLFPTDPAIWGEDYIMQGAMRFAGVKVGVLGRKVIVFTRLPSNRNLCKKVVRPANAWLEYVSGEGRPTFTLQAEEWLKGEVAKNIEKNYLKKLKAEHLDLGLETERIQIVELQRKRTSETSIPLEVLLGGKDVLASKRRRGPTSEEIEIEDVLSEDESDFSEFIEEMAETWTTIESHRIKVGNKEFALQDPFREWQLKALRAVGQFLERNEGTHGYIDAATAAGKTFLMAALFAMALQSTKHKKNVLIVTPTIELVQQTHEDCRDFYLKIAPKLDPNKLIKVSHEHTTQKLLLKNKLLDRGGYCVIICVNSLMKMLEADPTIMRHFRGMIVDELHEIPTKILLLFKKLAEEHEKLVLGFTATPGKMELIGECIFKYSSQEGVEEKLLCPWVVDKLAFPFTEENLKAFYKSLPTMLNTKKHAHGGFLTENKGIIYVRSIKEAEELESFLRHHHVKAGASHSGKTNNRAIVDEFKRPVNSSNINLLIAVEKFKIGFNAKVDFEIFARDDLSESDWFQIRGRALRNHAPTSTEEGEMPRQKVAYIIVFSNARLPQGFVLDSKALALDHHYLKQDEYYAWSLRRQVVDVYETSRQPPSPALQFTFESLENRSHLPIAESETAIIPVTYSEGPLEQAAAIGALWHEHHNTNGEIVIDFNTVRAITVKNPTFRQKLRARKRDESESYTLVEEAITRLMIKARERRFEDVQKLYQIQVYQYDGASKQYAFKEKLGNPKSRQVIYLCKSQKRVPGPVVPHYDFLVLNPKAS